MATDKGGNAVGFGDYVIADVMVDEQTVRAVVRIVKLSETPKGVSAIGAFVDLVGNGRVAKPSDLLSQLVSRVRSDLDELRWRLSDEPNPMYESEEGECLHSEEFGCSWRCFRRTAVEYEPVRGNEALRAYLGFHLGPCLFAVLDGDGEDVRSIDPTSVIVALREELADGCPFGCKYHEVVP